MQRPEHADECEQSLLAAAILSPPTIDEVSGLVDAGDFGNAQVALVWRTLVNIAAAGQRPDLPLLLARLRELGEADPHTLVWLADLIQGRGGATGAAIAANARHYARQIREAAARARLSDIAAKIGRLACDGHLTADDALGQAEVALLGLRDNRQANTVVGSPALMEAALETMKQRREGTAPGLLFGLEPIDALANMRPGQLIVLGARPAMGKTAFAGCIVAGIAPTNPVLFISLEMSHTELSERIIANIATVNYAAVSRGLCFGEQADRVASAAAEISRWHLFVDDTPSQTVSQIASKARRIKRKHQGIGLVVVDYIQLVRPETARGATRETEVASISRGLKELAKQLGWPVLCLCQLNRAAEAGDQRPRLQHLRESGAIEQDADLVAFLLRRDVYRKRHERDGRAEVFIEKNRGGETGEAVLNWAGEHMRFTAPPAVEEFDANRGW